MTKRTHDHARPPHATSSTTATRHVYLVNTPARALLEPSLLFGPCQIGISPGYAPYQKPRPRWGFDNADIGPSLSHVSLYHTKLLSRTYLYDFVRDVTRFTHLVTSHKPASRHIDMRIHFCRQHVELGDVATTFAPTPDMVADFMTKQTQRLRHERHCRRAFGNQHAPIPLEPIVRVLV